MTAYDEIITQQIKKYDGNYDEWEQTMSQIHHNYMDTVLMNYLAVSPETEVIKNLLNYAVNYSQTGSAAIDLSDKQLADSVMKIIWDEIGDYMMACDYYKEGDAYVISCLFRRQICPEYEKL